MRRGCSPISAPSRQGRAARGRSDAHLSAAGRRRQRLVRLSQFRKEERYVGQVDLDALLNSADVLIDFDRHRHSAHPHLVAVDLCWFGKSGPYRDFKTSDAICRALAGFVQLIGPAEGPPLTLPDYQSAIMGGLAAFIPAMASLLGGPEPALGGECARGHHRARRIPDDRGLGDRRRRSAGASTASRRPIRWASIAASRASSASPSSRRRSGNRSAT